ncbi:uncharacterized protein PHACADRAFT_114068 [Phanerochaete carnosa HHB-10118-sp]|uniref:Phospholipid/glycerol acyltransferase domain-containing protein n=1 Tax=Phanerochaete carnosa (strain HHB-10118-sp) TaxID=650164 RepID=K5W656_PHACS|nr:uncharacterized protein PHACADRAFT_114068 [Phanerochaete carnosa HHB-10118-sp]EKM59393.1 hypothetical protein PHACADRAFT_114068 [Phanerochaete carnosa HHB-10118-sp]
MEKFSAFRDPGTGIQPFLTPIPPVNSDVLATALLPVGYLLGVIRTALIAVLGVLYALLVSGVCAVLIIVPPLHRAATYILTAFITRLVLLLVGVWWIPVGVVTRKRTPRGSTGLEKWNPKAGDVIVSNWVSWIELLWLAFRFDPIFVLPVSDPVDLSSASRSSTPLSVTPGRRTGTGSAAISSPSTRAPTPHSNIVGFRKASLFSMLAATGSVPLPRERAGEYSPLEDIRRRADRPIVVFPECTTSNGRGLLRFVPVFSSLTLPVKDFQVFVMCVRYDPPTPLTPTLSHSLPSKMLNPLPHIFRLANTLLPLTLSIRLLVPSESPSSGAFLASEFSTPGSKNNDILTEACAALIAQIGKTKRVGLGWEDKVAFLEFYKGRRK